MKPVYFYSPEHFYAEVFPALRDLRDECYWFVNRILTLQSCFKDSDWVTIGTRSIEKFIHPRHVSKIKMGLVEAGVIERDGRYLSRAFDVTGKGKCEGYRIADAFITGRLRRVECWKVSLSQKVLDHREHVAGKQLDPAMTDALHTWLRSRFNPLEIDEAWATRIIDMPIAVPPDVVDLDKYRLRCESRRAGMRLVTDLIARKEPDFLRDDFGRVHTPVTRMASELRPCLSIGGRPLANLDIRNSQIVFMILAIFSDSLRGVGSTYGTTCFPSLPFIHPSSLSKRKTQQKLNKTATPQDVSKFIDLVINGQLYDLLMRTIGVADRREFKGMFFEQVLFGDDAKPYTDTDLRRLFTGTFPTVDAAIRQAKQHDYRALAWMLQRSESAFMIGGVCNRLRIERPLTPCLTVHDSIMTTGEHVGPVRDIIMEEFAKLGLNPALHVEHMSGVAQ